MEKLLDYKKFFLKYLKWHLNYYFLRKASPLICVFYITNRCNLKCSMCNIWRDPKPKTLSLDKFKRIVDDLAEMGCGYLSLSGGEPLILPDILDRLNYARNKIEYVHLVTNGYLIDEEMAKKLGNLKLDDISISIDGTEDVHDSIRGVKGSYNKAIQAIKYLKIHAPKTKIVVNTILSPYNLYDLPTFMEVVENLKVYQKFQPINIHPLFKNQKSKSEYSKLNEVEIAKLKEIIKLIKNKKHILNSKFFIQTILNYFLNKPRKGPSSKNCVLPNYYCEFLGDHLYPCLTAFDWENGFKLDKDLRSVFYSKEYKRAQKNLKNCRLCQKNMYICYLEPRISLPFTNFIRYKLTSGNK